jgi:8-oxo-dGTP diphosphatase
MEKIVVVAALIKRDNKYLIGLRSTGKYRGLWEFPGGKVNVGEALEESLKREILEEFEISIDITKQLFRIDHTYPDFILEMHCFLASTNEVISAHNDHSEIMWFDPTDNDELKWLPADLKVVELLRNPNF